MIKLTMLAGYDFFSLKLLPAFKKIMFTLSCSLVYFHQVATFGCPGKHANRKL